MAARIQTGGNMTKEKPDNDNGVRYHITLNKYDREALEHMGAVHGVSRSAAIRVCIRAAALNVGFKPPTET